MMYLIEKIEDLLPLKGELVWGEIPSDKFCGQIMLNDIISIVSNETIDMIGRICGNTTKKKIIATKVRNKTGIKLEKGDMVLLIKINGIRKSDIKNTPLWVLHQMLENGKIKFLFFNMI